jgi:hypothetical protein
MNTIRDTISFFFAYNITMYHRILWQGRIARKLPAKIRGAIRTLMGEVTRDEIRMCGEGMRDGCGWMGGE